VNGQKPEVFRPVILAVDDEPQDLKRVERELRKRYGADYRVVCEGSAKPGLKQLRDFKATGEDVAVGHAHLTGVYSPKCLEVWSSRKLKIAMPARLLQSLREKHRGASSIGSRSELPKEG
jgi:hypothetical protein